MVLKVCWERRARGACPDCGEEAAHETKSLERSRPSPSALAPVPMPCAPCAFLCVTTPASDTQVPVQALCGMRRSCLTSASMSQSCKWRQAHTPI